MKRIMNKFPILKNTLSAKNAKQIMSVMSLNSWSRFPVEERMNAIEILVRNMFSTLEAVGIYEEIIYKDYVRLSKQKQSLKSKINKMRRKNRTASNA